MSKEVFGRLFVDKIFLTMKTDFVLIVVALLCLGSSLADEKLDKLKIGIKKRVRLGI